MDFSHGGLAVCMFLCKEFACKRFVLRFQRMRYNKLKPDAFETIKAQLSSCLQPIKLDYLLQPPPTLGAGPASSLASNAPGCVHCAKRILFPKLYAYLTFILRVQRSCNAASGVEVFSCPSDNPEDDPHNIACGLMLHPPSGQVVATPFACFAAMDSRQTGSLSSQSQSLDRHARDRRDQRVRSSASPLVEGPELYSCTVKTDGSMIVANVWQGRLCTNTRRWHDSVQAKWARAWLQAAGARLLEGHTYVLEAMYADNKVCML